jgi:hypothetical protein
MRGHLSLLQYLLATFIYFLLGVFYFPDGSWAYIGCTTAAFLLQLTVQTVMLLGDPGIAALRHYTFFPPLDGETAR